MQWVRLLVAVTKDTQGMANSVQVRNHVTTCMILSVIPVKSHTVGIKSMPFAR